MNVNPWDDLPLVSRARLDELAGELHSNAKCGEFVRRYVQMWDSRYGRLFAAVVTVDEPATADAILSIKSSSQMIGALRLAAMAAGAEQLALRDGSSGMQALLPRIRTCGQSTMLEVERTWLEMDNSLP